MWRVPPKGRGRGIGLCLLVRLADRLATIHDHWLCAFASRNSSLWDCFTNVMQRWLTIHGDCRWENNIGWAENSEKQTLTSSKLWIQPWVLITFHVYLHTVTSRPVNNNLKSTIIPLYVYAFWNLSSHKGLETWTRQNQSKTIKSLFLPSMGLGRKCAAGFVFFTRFPFIGWPSLFRPRNQARPDSCCL